MPFRIDARDAAPDAFERLIDIGALDIERFDDGSIAAVMPDRTTPEQLASALGTHAFAARDATPRDGGSVWVLRPRPVQVGRVRIAPADADAKAAGTITLIDGGAFGTGLHPTTALCLEALDDACAASIPRSILDVGTGSGILAVAALAMGVPTAAAIDIDDEALRIAAENASQNGVRDRLQLARGGPEVLDGAWPLVFANIVAGSLLAIAPALVRRVDHQGTIVLSGIAVGVEDDVERAYRRLGMHRVRMLSRAGWVALVMRASW